MGTKAGNYGSVERLIPEDPLSGGPQIHKLDSKYVEFTPAPTEASRSLRGGGVVDSARTPRNAIKHSPLPRCRPCFIAGAQTGKRLMQMLRV